MIVDLVQTGTDYGSKYWERWGTDCLIKMDFERTLPVDEVTPEYFMLGSMFHQYQSELILNGNKDCLDFKDCAPELSREAFRLFQGFLKSETCFRYLPRCEVIAVERLIAGPEVDAMFGVSPITGQLDLLVREPDGLLYIWDWKTCSSWKAEPIEDFRSYNYGSAMMSRIRYVFGAEAMGLGPIEGFRICQIKKTKEVQVRLLDPCPSNRVELEQYKKYLQYCQDRKNNYPREALLSQCMYCKFNKNCSKGL